MTHRTVVLSSWEEGRAALRSPEDQAEDERDRNERLLRFPHVVMLQVSYPELDFADRWCWQHFGPRDGDCGQSHSEYPACAQKEGHSHSGKWTSHWFVKTDYDFGFNEWYFMDQRDRDEFLASVSEINWGENYPKLAAAP